MKEGIDYNIISETDFYSKQEAKNFVSLICLKLYNESHCTDYVKSLYIERPILNNNNSVEDVVKEVVTLHCPNFKSRAVTVYYKE